MARHHPVEIEGEVIEARPHSIFCVALSNGHRLLARLAEERAAEAIEMLPGDKVMLEVFPYDLSKGRITSRRVTTRR